MNNWVINTSGQNSSTKLLKAIEFAAYKHRLQKRKGTSGLPYINHPISVSCLISTLVPDASLDLLIAGLLHDTIEDTITSEHEILTNFGPAVLEIVLEVTDDMSLPSKVRKQKQVVEAPFLSSFAKCIKIADKTCNINDILFTRLKWSRKRKIAYVEWAICVVEKIRGDYPQLEQSFDDAVLKAQTILRYNFIL